MAKDRLDVSIKNVEKLTKKHSKELNEYISSKGIIKIEEKIDGIKINIIKAHNTGDLKRDLKVYYKNDLLIWDEFNYLSDSDIKMFSTGNAQFKFCLDEVLRFNKEEIKKLEINTELFFEYVMRKSTLSHTYTELFNLIFIKATTEQDMSYFKQRYPIYVVNNNYKAQSLDFMIKSLKQDLKEYSSVYGGIKGTAEGFVIKTDIGLFKLQKESQNDQEERTKIKNKHRMEPYAEELYWSQVRSSALYFMENNSHVLALPYHSKKNKVQVLDDIMGNVKFITHKRLPGNNGALFIGKFRVLTVQHLKIIKEAYKEYDTLTICVVTSKDTKSTKEFRLSVLNEVLKKNNIKANVIKHGSGNIFGIMNKSACNINVIVAGTDRVEAYRETLKNNPDLSVCEIKRTDEDCSATKAFKDMSLVPEEIRYRYCEFV